MAHNKTGQNVVFCISRDLSISPCWWNFEILPNDERELGVRPTPITLAETDDGPLWLPFFLLVSKWFSEAIRLSETGVSAEISL